MKKIVLVVLFFLSLLEMDHLVAQNLEPLSNAVPSKIQLRSHLLVHLDSMDTSFWKQLVQRKTPIAIYPSGSESRNRSFIREYAGYHDTLVVLGHWEVTQGGTHNLGIINVDPNHVLPITLDSLGANKVLYDATKQFVAVHAFGPVKTTDSVLVNLWTQLGKMPNFIEADSISWRSKDSLVVGLNARQKVFGVVRSETELLTDVTFKDFEETRVNGYFSFPVPQNGTLPILIPHKAGYHFSPDIIYTSPENRHNSKEFVGFQLDSEYGLSHHYIFGKAIVNKIEEEGEELISNGIQVHRDSIKGTVGYFDERAYIDAGLTSKSALQSSFSISAWVKPTELHLNNSILGKGDTFVFKIHNGFLTFTMAGVKDYVSESSPIPLNRWTHVALVHSKTDNELLFYIDGIRSDKVTLIADYKTSDYNLLIGSNLWEEFFVGYIKEIKIWDRELNDTEIDAQFERIQEKTSPFKVLLVAAVALLIIVLTVYLIWLRKRPRNKISSLGMDIGKLNGKEGNGFPIGEYATHIGCFGTLRILDIEGRDVAKKLSPLQKKLFLVLFLFSQDNRKGIGTKQLTEILWPGKSVGEAKNTRGTNIQNLRNLLEACPGIALVFKDKYWFLHIADNCYCDYRVAQYYLDVLSEEGRTTQNLKGELTKLLEILKAGRFLANSSNPWLDPFIEKFSNRIIGNCLSFVEQLKFETDGDLLFTLAEVICLYDDLNERALVIKLRVLIEQGKLSLAHKAHDNFIRLYEQLYKESYNCSFDEMVSRY